MRKHHKRWVALLGAAAIASSGLVGLPGAVAADEKDTRTLAWPEISQGVSSYSLDGYEIGYLPSELERHGIHASTTTDRLGNRQSQLSWMRGPDQLLGRVSILRSDSMQQLDDLRERRYGHLPERTLERLDSGEALRSEAYLSPETGDLFWLDEPGVAVALYLQPDKWGSGELVRMAESLTRKEAPAEGAGETDPEGSGSEEPTTEEPTAEEPAQEGPDAQEGSGGEAGGAAPEEGSGGEATQEEPAEAGSTHEPVESAPETTGEKEPQEPAGTDGSAASADGTAVDASPAGRPGTPETPEAAETSETPQAPSGQGGEAAQEEPTAGEGAQEAPAESGESGQAAGSEQPGATRVRMAKECVVSRFVSFGSGETRLGEMTPASAEFVERAVAAERLGDGDLDRLLATVWYYGDEGVKTGAVEHCAEDVEMSRTELEGLIADLGEIIAVLVEEAEKHDATHEENVARTLEEVNATLPVEVDATSVMDPIGAQEWAELTRSLPWSFPAGTS
ncbi:hypothetical protein [Nocardiopsis sp. HUAS JQ3]|uniref:hypothetical protein n=1 Tax=Nocardiopsis sp. HUAS JQ3 TaxID=3061629 RepID=UPI0023A95959|nr:hypothetical protein [Nocardiopsis sp. HUAS JQ3]WDZ92295.1 hypothetical protein PV789_07090 [Nocardiopsis sp. HUAS JQ3]